MENKKLLYEYLVIIIRDGIPEIIPFQTHDHPENVDKFFDKTSEQWSDAFLCKVIKGPPEY